MHVYSAELSRIGESWRCRKRNVNKANRCQKNKSKNAKRLQRMRGVENKQKRAKTHEKARLYAIKREGALLLI